MVVIVAEISLVVLRVVNGLVTIARGSIKGAEKVHQISAAGVWTTQLTGILKVCLKAHQILQM